MYLYETSKIAFFQYFLKIMWDYLNLLLLLFFSPPPTNSFTRGEL